MEFYGNPDTWPAFFTIQKILSGFDAFKAMNFPKFCVSSIS